MNYEMHYEPQRDVIQIHFQKTDGVSDWIANILEFSSRYYDSITFEGGPLQLRVHHGWAEMYRSIKYEVRRQWLALNRAHPDAATEIIGWSLGSGQAVLCAQDLNFNFGLRAYVYTFGSVKPFRYTLFNKEKTLRYLSGLTADCRNFAIRNDLVTYTPPFWGYTTLHRVELMPQRRTLKKLLNPNYYHMVYHIPNLYDNK